LSNYQGRNRRQRVDKYDGIIFNDGIRANEVRVNSEEGSLGVMPTRQAILEAQGQGLDLIMINDKATPPVCRIADLNKYLYEQKQRQKEAKKKQRENAVEQKEIRMGLNIDTGDIEVKCNKIRKMLEKNAKVTITVTLKGRERSRQDLAEQLLKTFADKLEVELEGFSRAGNRVSAKIA
jgi:translation initiation factor IF-3